MLAAKATVEYSSYFASLQSVIQSYPHRNQDLTDRSLWPNNVESPPPDPNKASEFHLLIVDEFGNQEVLIYALFSTKNPRHVPFELFDSSRGLGLRRKSSVASMAFCRNKGDQNE